MEPSARPYFGSSPNADTVKIPTASCMTIITSERTIMITSILPPDLNMENEAMNPTEQKNTRIQMSLMVSSKVIPTTSPSCKNSITMENRSPPTTAAGIQNFLRRGDFITRNPPMTSTNAPTAAL